MLAFVVALALARSPPKLVDEAVALSNRGQFALAAERLVQALALNPNLSEAHYPAGLAPADGWRREAALASFRRAAQLAPGHPAAPARVCELETWFAVARESGYEQAAARCRAALALAPGDRGNATAALASLRAALRLRFELALAYLDAQNPAAAIPLTQGGRSRGARER